MNDADMMAYLRYRAIESVLDAQKGKVDEMVKEVASRTIFDPYFNRSFSFSDRTVYRYLKLYRLYGFDGLKPKVNRNRNNHCVLSPEQIRWITQLKEQLPLRSVRKIIAMLEASCMKERTVSRVLHDMGYTRSNLARDKNVYNHNVSADIFEQYQGDMMEGVYITDKNGNKRKVYLFGFIDNFSKFVPHSQFYYESSLPRMEDCLKKAITKYGVPERVYLDNGKVYVSYNFKLSCARLGIRLSYATPYHPAGKGCIERFWQFVQSDFLTELRLHPVDDIRMLYSRLASINKIAFSTHQVV
ncbi:DDE-type integrase/transposase/recombinase [Mahella australiensis]|uniref:Integrase catalytic region n=1 Tax=Mahella australiensis (strain DSM 15567 / CIP 107919 / 50-1 BON) TaxID=697281 RepID=F3ZWH7_MAHA5|nr:DDE-type integrase/transposase/recombinase [Mahella australiensis]AEE95412.1 Integrase catalytic region [Mahella australiensis 50-1 BON]